MNIDPMTANDWPAVRMIYLEGIATGHATFETEAPDWAGWDQGHLAGCRL
ncbi:MAG TPA: N-acetyltransferase, partial [Anaerolineae bacterium]